MKLLESANTSEARDPAAASLVFVAACDKGHAGACLELGRLRGFGLGGPIDPESSATATREACDRGLDPACASMAVKTLFAWGQRRDTVLARILAQRSEAGTRRACADGDGFACIILGDLSDAGLIAGGPPAMKSFRDQGRRLLGPPCEHDDGIACSWLSSAEAPGSDRAKDAARRACDLGVAKGCSDLAYASLEGADPDPAQAFARWKTGCDANDPWACHALCTRSINGRGLPKNPTAARPFCERAVPLFTRTCDLGSGVGCAALAWYYQNGWSIPQDKARAAKLFAASAEPLRSMCESHSSAACWYLASNYANGLGVPKDFAARLGAERLQCESGDGSACFAYAERLRSGALVERSLERAKFYDNQACELGHAAGCAAASASQTIAQKQPSPTATCPTGQKAEEGSPNHCCFLRQVWSDKDGRCLGDPACPEGMVAKDGTCLGEREVRQAELVARVDEANRILAKPGKTIDDLRACGRRAQIPAELAIRANPQDPRGYVALGTALEFQYDYDAAIRAYERGANAVEQAGNLDGGGELRKKIVAARESQKLVAESEARIAENNRATEAIVRSGGVTRNPDFCRVAKLWDDWCAANGYDMPSLLPGEDRRVAPAPRQPRMGEVIAGAIEQARTGRPPATASRATSAASTGFTMTPGPDCSNCSTECASVTARCQTTMRACYEAAACVCRCQRSRGGCGMSIPALDQCVADNTAQADRLAGGSGTAVNTARSAPEPAAAPRPKVDCDAEWSSCLKTSCKATCSGVCSAPAEDPCVLHPGGCSCRCSQARAACAARNRQ
jgi:TPR repeat protein